MSEINPLGNERALAIDKLLEAFESIIDENAGLLTESLIKSFVDKLDATGGNILSSAQNLKRIELLDRAFHTFNNERGTRIVSHLMSDMEKILLLNENYFKELTGGRKIQNSDIKDVIRQRLGIGANGELIRDGYMMGLLNDPQVRNEIRSFAYAKVIGGTGFQDFRKGLRDLIQGDEQKLGAFKRFYRNYAFDTYAQVDAMNGKMYADKLKLKYFIYNGGIMRDKKGNSKTRPFCLKRANKVFSSEEAEKWKSDKDLTAIENRATYNWQLQRGGYACRHSIDYITEGMAFNLRPELRQAAKDPGKEAAPGEAPAPPPKQRQRITRDPHTKWDDIPDLKIRKVDKDLDGWQPLHSNWQKAKAIVEKHNKILSDLHEEVRSLKWSDPVQFERIREISTLQGKHLAIRTEALNLIDQYQADARKLLVEKNGTASKFTVNNPYKGKKDYAVLNANIKAAEDFIRGIIGGNVNDGTVYNVKARQGVRAYYRRNDHIMLEKNQNVRVIVHEMAHDLEYSSNWIFKRSVDFLERRTKGRPAVRFVDDPEFKGYGYSPDETYLPDEFYKKYVGKPYKSATFGRYRGYRATEIISMGLERMYADPLDFFQEDDDYFNFLYSLFTE